MDCERIWKYDVFLNFKGEDTGNNFTGDLFAALSREGIKTFNGDQKEKGEAISPEILEAIEQSRISVVVFSRNYASSTLCLEELAKIAQCHDLVKQTVLPVFYDVHPSEVRHQRGIFQQAFAEHEERFKDNLEKLERWRISMTKVANLRGWDVRNGIETAVIYNKVTRAISILNPSCLSVADDLVGIQTRGKKLEKLLDIGSDDGVRFVGICGMGGIGKTTLASVVYHKICHLFEACCFLANVSESYDYHGLVHLQNQLIFTIMEGGHLRGDLYIKDIYDGKKIIKHLLISLRVLIVLDNVDRISQLENLIEGPHCFGSGTKIIITTRDEYLLKCHGVNEIYKVELLNKDEAFRLFCKYAFKCDYPMRNYEELTRSALEYAGGLPIAIKMLASSLLDQSVSDWRSALDKMLQTPHKQIMDVLRISFDSLDDDMEKGIFLDIACFFIGEEIEYVKNILEYCGFNTATGIEVLKEKSFMTISNQRIQMHNTLQELGREIVRQECVEKQGKRSRLWLYDDFRHVMETDMGTIYVQAIVLNMQDPEGTPLRAEAFSRMTHLRLLILRNVNFSGTLKYLSKDLRYLSWHRYPFICLPSGFQPLKLFELILTNSSITRLWEGRQFLPNLRSINLRDSRALIKMPDFTGLPNLERLDLEGCTALLRLDPSIAFLPKLTFLKLRNCISLVSIPNTLFDLSSLEILNLAGCSKLTECLDFDHWRSSLEVKVLSNQHPPFLEALSYSILIHFPEKIKNNKLVFGCLSCLIDRN